MSEVRVPTLAASVVTFRPDPELLRRTLLTLFAAVQFASARMRLGPVKLWLVDNTPPERADADAVDRATRELARSCARMEIETIRGHGNIGFGRGHNLALARSAADFHLVLNPDVELAEDAIVEALRFMERNPSVGVIAPRAVGPSGEPLYLCKRYPAVVDLLVRGFAPRWLLALWRPRIERYEMHELVARDAPAEVPIASGCFMFCRKGVLDAVGAFSSRFFLYFEDFDLSLRAAQVAKVVYVPAVRIVHHGGHAARKGPAHIHHFCRSALLFYRAHGWKVF